MMITSNKAKVNFSMLGLTTAVVAAFMMLGNVAQASMMQSRTASYTSSKSAATQNQLLRIGSRGAAVNKLQTALKKDGFYSGAIDGIFGRQTQAAVVKFQQSRKLAADGVVGTRTRSALSI